ncbi:MAG: NUDIX hydrolase [Lachnospiraceae bacterium]|nr:NUDIX hydrolase [Lachnospiraceae bacterium]
MDKPIIKNEQVDTLYDAKYLKLYDLRYMEGKHYFDCTRRDASAIVAVKSDEEFRSMLPDAVTIAVVLHLPDEEPKLLLSYEYRYPVGRFLLSPVAGLLDPEDAETDDPLRTGAIREIFEETGVRMAETDTLTVLNPCAFSSPGMTDESNAFLRADITVENTEMLSQSGAVGSELFNGFELVTKEEARKLFRTGRDRFGNTFSLATWVILADFVMES